MAKLRNYIGYGLHADRPPAGAPGALYCESDTGAVLRDSGTGWDLIASTGPSTRVVMAPVVDTTIAAGNTLISVSVPDLHYTMPDPALNPGKAVDFGMPVGPGITINVLNHDSSDLLVGWSSPTHFISDGTIWTVGD